MSPVAIRNIFLLAAAGLGFAAAALFEFPRDPARPYLLVVGFLALLKLNIEYALGLPMHLPRLLATPPERSKRRRILLASWGLIPLLVYGAVAW